MMSFAFVLAIMSAFVLIFFCSSCICRTEQKPDLWRGPCRQWWSWCRHWKRGPQKSTRPLLSNILRAHVRIFFPVNPIRKLSNIKILARPPAVILKYWENLMLIWFSGSHVVPFLVICAWANHGLGPVNLSTMWWTIHSLSGPFCCWFLLQV